MKKILDWNEYQATAVEAIEEGCVLLENKNNALPIKKDTVVSVFGRIQNNYYKSGTGSGGKVNVSKVYSIIDGLEESGQIKLNKELQQIYANWEKDHPYDEGIGWGKERWSQDEMLLDEKTLSDAANVSQVAIAIIGRTAGEDKDNSASEGSYLLTAEEKLMLKNVRQYFKTVIVVLNVGNIIDMSFVEDYSPDAVLYCWQGGMVGGIGTANVLTGKASPSGKLTDTIAKNITDYPSVKYFGCREGNCYTEDIFVGYRYFETFAKDKVLYPFGYGLTYSTFKTSAHAQNDSKNQKLSVLVTIENAGAFAAKEVAQIYVKAPNGKLGKAEKVLVGFEKTELLKPQEKQTLSFEIPYESFASYDDSGVTQNKSAWVLEEGTYTVFAGTDVRSSEAILDFEIDSLLIIKQCEEAMAPRQKLERFHNDNGTVKMETAPLSTVKMLERRKERLPKELKQVTTTSIQLKDVLNKSATMDDFISQFSDDDLSCIIRGEGMGSSLVTPGTASAYGGVSPRLKDTFGIPACCCDDGPSGMRLDCGIKAFALPNGTLLASSFNKKLVKKLYAFTGLEMVSNKVENLLGPGMNIHRHPCNGRNFEYFSEDPFVTGQIGSAMVQGLQSSGVTGCIKHFCGNNQESNRYAHNSIVSERALREIYLKGFEIAVKNGADSVMTTYGLVNGIYTAGNYDLNTTILRKDWGFTGIVMTDWWANINDEEHDPDKSNFASMIKAQNDLYMCCPNGAKNESNDNTLTSLEEGTLSRGELQLCAKNICNQVMKMPAMARLLNQPIEVEIINRPKEADDVNLEDIEFILLDGDKKIDLTYQECKANTNYILAFDCQKLGTYEVTLTGSSELGALAQLPCTLFFMGIPCASFIFNGSEGKDVSITKEFIIPTRFAVSRLQVASNGLKLKELTIKFLNDNAKTPW